jgi:hypothetical protein
MAMNRLKMLALLCVGVVAILIAGIHFSGSFDARVEVDRTAMGPASLSVNGQLGKAKPAEASQAKSSEWPVTVTSRPYDGPTTAERAALADLRAALAMAHARQLKAVPPEARDMFPPVPDIRLPARPLTGFEIDELHRKAHELRDGL